MISLIRATIRAFAAPNHQLSSRTRVWKAGVKELRSRTEGRHESGAFLLGRTVLGKRSIERFAYYDDLDPESLKSGIVVFDGAGYGPLWALCKRLGLQVVADI